jgi:MinD superfamily P-loop ATPase
LDYIRTFVVPKNGEQVKSDIHPESAQKIKDFASEKDFKILAEIPYDLSIPNAITQAVPVVKAYPESQSSTIIKCLSDKLIDLIQQSA